MLYRHKKNKIRQQAEINYRERLRSFVRDKLTRFANFEKKCQELD